MGCTRYPTVLQYLLPPCVFPWTVNRPHHMERTPATSARAEFRWEERTNRSIHIAELGLGSQRESERGGPIETHMAKHRTPIHDRFLYMHIETMSSGAFLVDSGPNGGPEGGDSKL